jgi:hypothetical protein
MNEGKLLRLESEKEASEFVHRFSFIWSRMAPADAIMLGEPDVLNFGRRTMADIRKTAESDHCVAFFGPLLIFLQPNTGGGMGKEIMSLLPFDVAPRAQLAEMQPQIDKAWADIENLYSFDAPATPSVAPGANPPPVENVQTPALAPPPPPKPLPVVGKLYIIRAENNGRGPGAEAIETDADTILACLQKGDVPLIMRGEIIKPKLTVAL